ncbi:MAG TPA: hypothetical protein VK961_06790 [Chthoniobacter sp.]|nr:hypothetical protein [Chthoniobacter sp.]
MKMPSLLTTALVLTFAAGAFAAEESAAKEGCKMMAKKEPAPEPACCCQKMMAAKSEAPAKAADLNALVDKMKTAKGDDVLNAFATVLNEILSERKAAQDKASEAATPPAEHRH